jgi:hypothetical protein
MPKKKWFTGNIALAHRCPETSGCTLGISAAVLSIAHQYSYRNTGKQTEEQL